MQDYDDDIFIKKPPSTDVHPIHTRPSKQFIKRGAIALGLLAIILIVQATWFKNLFVKKNKKSPVVASVTVGDIVTRDTNGNGIPDWEEKLWGLDPTVLYTNGVSNIEIITTKKKSLGIQNINEKNLDDTDRLARELFTLTAALGQSDEVDDATLKAISAKLASSVDIKQVNNTYTLKDIQTTQTSIASLNKYRSDLKRIVSTYDANTADIEVLITALQNGDGGKLPALNQSATTYRSLARELTSIKVPLGLAQDHLIIVNSFTGIATSLIYMTELNDNSIAALVGLAIYRNYNNKLNTGLTNMNEYLARYGIL